MASASAPPCTLFQSGDVSRALTGLGPAGVARVLRWVLQRNTLQSLGFSALQHLQHLQRPVYPACTCVEACEGAPTRGRRPVASVASVVELKSIYISMLYLQHTLQRLAFAPPQGVAAPRCSIGSAAPQAIKYPRIFKGLGGSAASGAETGRNGVLGVSAPGSRRERAAIGERLALGLDLGEMGRFRPSSPVPQPPVASEGERYQQLRRNLPFTVPANMGVASPQNRPPRPPAEATPGDRPPPSFLARPAAPAPALPGSTDRSGENADRWGRGFRGSGSRGSGAAKTGGLGRSGSGEVCHG